MSDFILHEKLDNDCFKVGNLPLCRVLMMNDRQYPWFILVPRRAELREIFELSSEDQRAFWHESAWFGEQIMTMFNGEKLNVAALGNMVPQLHIHHIVRHQYDASWPKPVWGASPARPYSVEDAATRIEKVEALLQDYEAPEPVFTEAEAKLRWGLPEKKKK
ncbi:HIT domain-containing protein [Aliidiomarina indica]|uniref:HIT domain-containing protein n=1 Tax=Aliidiomarina indica TaxID=2749147 RepID=UPI0018900F02|nr:HIT domain-containing protein [Aliidiomarina indica]